MIMQYSVLQNHLNLLHERSVRWQLKFNVSKCKHVHFGPVHQFGLYYLDGIMISSVKFQKDLGILFDNHLHTTEVTAKANRLLGDLSIILT